MIENYKNKQWLYQKYWVDECSLYDMAKICKCVSNTILYWMRKHNKEVQKVFQENKELKAINFILIMYLLKAREK